MPKYLINWTVDRESLVHFRKVEWTIHGQWKVAEEAAN